MDMNTPEMKAIAEAIQQPDKAISRAMLLKLWERLSPTGDPMQVSTMAHFLADTETDPASELEWDLRALEAVVGSRAPEDLEPVSDQLVGLLPSLHLSVAEGYRRLGEIDTARKHVEAGANRIGVLADDAYGNLVRGGLRRLQGLLGI